MQSLTVTVNTNQELFWGWLLDCIGYSIHAHEIIATPTQSYLDFVGNYDFWCACIASKPNHPSVSAGTSEPNPLTKPPTVLDQDYSDLAFEIEDDALQNEVVDIPISPLSIDPTMFWLGKIPDDDFNILSEVLPQEINFDVLPLAPMRTQVRATAQGALAERTLEDIFNKLVIAYPEIHEYPKLISGNPPQGQQVWERIPDHGSDREIIRLWQAGLTNQEIGMRLGYQPRYVTRKVSELRQAYPDAGIFRAEERQRALRKTNDSR